MKTWKLACKDLGNRTCSYVARGGSDEEVKESMRGHAGRAHPRKVKTVEQQAALERKMAGVLWHEPVVGLGAHGRYGQEEEKTETGPPLKAPRNPVGRDPSEPRRNAERDQEVRDTGMDRGE